MNKSERIDNSLYFNIIKVIYIIFVFTATEQKATEEKEHKYSGGVLLV